MRLYSLGKGASFNKFQRLFHKQQWVSLNVRTTNATLSVQYYTMADNWENKWQQVIDPFFNK